MTNYENQEGGLKRAGIDNDAYTGQMAGAAQLGVKPSPEKHLRHLVGMLDNTYSRYSNAIATYRNMNDCLTGCGPETVENDVPKSVPNGLIFEAIEKLERLHDLCAILDNENDRLNSVIDTN